MHKDLRTVLYTLRPPFLLLTPVCVALGAATVIADGGSIDPAILALVLAGALLAHISVNTLNEYYDLRSGLDLNTQRTPFSGGSGALPDNPGAANAVFATGVFSLTACLLIGIYFAWRFGAEILPIGLLGAVLIITYTEWLNRSPLLCLLAPGLGFGLLMVAGTAMVLTGQASELAWIAGLLPFFLVNNLLLLNQYPDIAADRAAGRNHFPIAYGVRASNAVYGTFLLAAGLVIIGGIAFGPLPSAALLTLLPMGPALYALLGAVRYGTDIGLHPAHLAANVTTAMLSPLVLATVLFLSR